jgi:hypothetical protein
MPVIQASTVLNSKDREPTGKKYAMRYVMQRASASLCSLTLLVAVLIAHPFVEMGVNDDWSYIYSAFHLVQTGHIAYFGWSEPILGWQLYWSALFLHCFGLSFSVARFSVLLIAAAATYLTHRILARCGVNDFNATLGTLALALSPVFLPLAFSFMSDIAGLFAILLCIDLCLRSLQAASTRSASVWLFLALAANVLLGTSRQVSWLGVLVIVPSAYWLLRDRRPSPALSCLVWLGGVFLIFACLRWFDHQPYTQQGDILLGIRQHGSRYEVAEKLTRLALTIPLLLLPVLIAFLTPKWFHGRSKRRAAMFAAASSVLLLLAAACLHHRGSLVDWLAPFCGNYFTSQGLINVPGIGLRSTVLDPAIRAIVTVLVAAACIACIACFLSLSFNGSLSAEQNPPQATSSRTLFLFLAPFPLCYCGLLLVRGLSGSMFDRYLLPILVVVMIALLRLYQRRVAARLPTISLVVLLLVAAFSIASLHDVYAIERARLAAAGELVAAGIPPTSFYGGFEYDGWTQVDAGGYVHSSHLNLPAGTKQSQSPISGARPCGYMFFRMFPAIQPSYALSFDPASCQGPSRFAPAPYRTWLPPRTGYIYIQDIAARDPEPAAPGSAAR